MATYTEHKLTDAQLIRLSQIVNDRPNGFGVALQALERKGLVVRKTDYAPRKYGKSCFYEPTAAGTKALFIARLEGW